MFKLRVILVAFLVTFIGAVSANHKSDHSVKERTKPTGSVYKAGDDVPVAKPAVVETTGARDGATIYSQKCAMCHDAGIAGAPKVGEASAWTDRVSKGEEALFSSAINGFTGSQGVMPAKGGCGDCSDEEVTDAVKHMLELLK
ncbi:c-type cytochrome [Aliikangiella sp. IMCC44359]|uniref:c-type cytochrome n=1 Tax=Aliikangiella sp. IMCC44359 TaxID=3459125 RepID=UPI00403AFA0E